MSTLHKIFTLNALAAALMSVYGPAFAAQEDDVSQFLKPSSKLSVGIGNWSSDRPQMGMFDGMRDSGGYLLFDADLINRNDATGTWQTLSIRNLGTSNREIRGEYLQQGNQGITLEYNQLTRDAPYTVNTGLTGIGTTTQTVVNIAPGAGNNIQLGTEREKFGIGFYKNLQSLMPGLDFKVNFTNETKDGNRHWGRGGAPEFAVEPIDFTTRVLEATLNFSGEKLQLTGGYIGSWFENGNNLVTSIGTATYYLSLPLDNQAHQVYVNGGYNFTPTTRGTFRVSYTHATQDEHIPTADIPGLAWAGAPTHLDGEVNTTLIQLGLTSRPMPKLSLNANLRYHNSDDSTPESQIISSGATIVHATPLSYETVSGKFEGVYNLPMGYNLIAGVDLSRQDRTVPFGSDTNPADGVDDQRYVPMRTDLDENTYRLQVRKTLSETLNGALAYLHSKRDGSVYSEAVHSDPGEGVLPVSIDPINIADRTRDKWRLSMDWSPTEALGLQVNYENSKDDYRGHTYGLRDGKAELFSADATYAVNDKWQVNAWYSRDDTKANQLGWREGSNGAAGNAELNKQDYLRDTGDSIGLGLKGKLSAKLKVGADLQWTRNKSEIKQELTKLTISPVTGLAVATTGTNNYATGTVPSQLPDITSTITRLKLYAEYALKKNADLRFDLIHERWKTDDWTWLMGSTLSQPWAYGAATDGTTIITDPKQSTTFLGVRYIYKFQ